MRNLNLDQLQTLIAIADLGTLAAAAQALHLAAPTVSLHIKELEARFKTELLLRGKRKAQLTPAGELLVQEGRKLMSASDDLFELVRRQATGCMGLVRIGLSAGASTKLLPLVLEMLAQQSPQVEIRLEAMGSAAAIQRIQAGTLDIGIVASENDSRDAGVHMEHWRQDSVIALLPSAWELPECITPKWLAERRWASFAPATQMHGLISAWFGRAGFNPRPYLSLSYPGALKSLAIASQSAALLPLEEVEELQQTSGVAIRPLEPPLMRPMALAYRPMKTPHLAIESVLHVLRQFSSP